MTKEELLEVTPDYIDDPNQVGNKIWRLTSGKGIEITKSTSSSIDKYNFDTKISTDEGNIISENEDGLYVPEITSRVEEITQDITDLRDKLEALKATEYRGTESVYFKKTESPNGVSTIQAYVNVSKNAENCIEVKPDGLFSRSMDLTPGSIGDIERRLAKLETDLATINQDIDNLRTSAKIDRSNEIVPPVVVPNSENL